MKKKALLLVILIFGVLMYSGCGSNPLVLDTDTAAQSLLNNLTFSDELTKISAETMSRIYSVEAADVVKSAVYISTGATAEEIAVFEAADAEAASRIKTALSQRIQEQQEAYQNYNPQELDKLSKAILQSRDNYVILCVAQDAEATKAQVEALLQGDK